MYIRIETDKGYCIVRETKFLWFKIYHQLYYGFCWSGLNGKKPYHATSVFSKFDDDVNRIKSGEMKHNEKWTWIKNKNAIKY
jgi:hypothetical protein